MANRTWRTIGLIAFVMLVVLGTTPLSREPLDMQPAATDSNPEYDRSDLILSQG